MAKKLKCWKKIGKYVWKKKPNIIVVQEVQVTRGRNFYQFRVIKDVGWKSEKIKLQKSFKTKAQAEKWAKSYMKKHNIC